MKKRKYNIPEEKIRHLDITDLERIERFKKTGYGGSVSDALAMLGVMDTIFAHTFKPLKHGMQLIGRALPVKLHSLVMDEINFEDIRKMGDAERKEFFKEMTKEYEIDGDHPQIHMMKTVQKMDDGSVLVFDCGGDM